MRRVTAFIFCLITFLCSAIAAQAQTNQVTPTWTFETYGLQPYGSKRITITPLSAIGNNGNLIVLGDPIRGTTTNSSFTTNLLNGSYYRVEISTGFQVYTLTNFFDANTTGAVDGGDPLYRAFGQNQDRSAYAPSLPYALALWMLKYAGVATNAAFFGSLKLPVNTNTLAGYVWTVTNATTGAGEFQESSGGGGSGGVSGPGSSTVNNLAAWNSAVGAVLKDSGIPLANVVLQAGLNTVSNQLVSASQSIANTSSNSVYGNALTQINTTSNSVVASAQTIANTSSNAVLGNAASASQTAINTTSNSVVTTGQASVNTASNSVISTAQSSINSSSNAVFSSALAQINTTSNSVVGTAQTTVNTSSNLVFGSALAQINTTSNSLQSQITAGGVTLTQLNTTSNSLAGTSQTIANTTSNAVYGNALSQINTTSNSLAGTAQTIANTTSNSVLANAQTAINASSNSLNTVVNTSSNSVYGTLLTQVNTTSNSLNTSINTSSNSVLANAQTRINSSSNSIVGQMLDASALTASVMVKTGATTNFIAAAEGTDFLTAGSTNTLTYKTFDAAAAGNTLKQIKSFKFLFPRLVDGAGCTYPNTNDFTANTFMVPLFSGSAATNVNFCRFAVRVPNDVDTSVDLTASLTISLSASDTGTNVYQVGMISIANSAAAAGTAANFVSLVIPGDASGASGDVESVSGVTLTSWKSNVTAGQWWLIELRRAGDNALDNSTVASYLRELEIFYTSTQ